MVFVTVHLASNLTANCLFFVLCLFTLFADYFQFDTFTVQLNGLRHELRYEDVFITSWTSFSDFSTYACTYSNHDKVRTACSNLSYFRAAGVLYQALLFLVLLTLFLSMLSLYLRMLGKDNQLSRLKLPHLLGAPLFVVAGAGYLWVSNVDHLRKPDGSREHIESDSGIQLLFVTAFVGILTLLHYLFLKHYRHIEDIGFSFKLFEEIQEKEDRIRDLEKDKKDYIALIQDIGDLKNFLCTTGLPKLELRTLLISDLLRTTLDFWHRNQPDDRSTVNASMAIDSVDASLAEPLGVSRRLKVGSGLGQTQKMTEDPAKEQLEQEKLRLEALVERLHAQLEDLNQLRLRELENFEEAEKERSQHVQTMTLQNQKLKGKNQKLKAQPPPKAEESPLQEHVWMQRQEIDELTLTLEALRKQAKALEIAQKEAQMREIALQTQLNQTIMHQKSLEMDLISAQDANQTLKETNETQERELKDLKSNIIGLKEELERQKQEIEALNLREKALLAQIEALERAKALLSSQLQMTTEDLAVRLLENEGLRGEIRAKDGAIETLEQEKAMLSEELNSRLDEITTLQGEIRSVEQELRNVQVSKQQLAYSLAETKDSKAETTQMSQEEVEIWRFRTSESHKSEADKAEERDKEAERLKQLLRDLQIRSSADLDRNSALWMARFEDLRSLALRQKDENDQMKADLGNLEGKIADLKREKAKISEEVETLRLQTQSLSETNSRLGKEVAEMGSRLAESRCQLSEASAMGSAEAQHWRCAYWEERNERLEGRKELETTQNRHRMRLEDARAEGWKVQEKLAHLERDLRSKQSQIDGFDQEMERLRGYIADLEGRIQAKSASIVALEQENSLLKDDIDSKTRTIGSLTDQQSALTAQLHQCQADNKALGASLTSLIWEKSDLEAALRDCKWQIVEISTMAQEEIAAKHQFPAISDENEANLQEIARLREDLARKRQQLQRLYELIEALERSLMLANEEQTWDYVNKREIMRKLSLVTAEKLAIAEDLETLRTLNGERTREMGEDAQGQAARLLLHTEESYRDRLIQAENRAKQAEKRSQELQNTLIAQQSAARKALEDLEALWTERIGLLIEDFWAQMSRERERIETLTATTKSQQTQIAALQDEKETLEVEVQTVTADLEETRSELSELSVTHDTCQARILELQHDCSKVESRAKDLEQQRTGYKELINRLRMQIELTQQLHEGQLAQTAMDFDAEREDVIEEFGREREALKEEIERLNEMLAQVNTEKEQQSTTIDWLGEERTRLETIALQLQAEVTQHVAKQATMINWLGAVWEDKEATERLKDELVERYTLEIQSYQHQLLKLREEFDRYKKEQDTWNKSLICAGEDKAFQGARRIKELEELLEQERARAEQLEDRLKQAQRQVQDLTGQLETLTEERNRLAADLEAKKDLETVIESLRAELAAKVQEVAVLERLREENKGKIAALTEALDRTKKELEAQRLRTAELEAQLRESQDQIIHLTSQIAILKDENSALNSKCTDQSVQITDLEQKLLRLQLENQRLEQALVRAERDVNNLKQWMQRAKTAESELMTTKHLLSMRVEEVEALRGDIEAVTERNETLDEENGRMRGEVAALNREKAALAASIAQAQGEIARMARTKEEDERLITELRENVQVQASTIEQLKAKIAELEAILASKGDDSAAFRGKLKELAQDRDRLRLQLAKAKDVKEQAEKDLTELEALRQALSQRDLTLAELRKELEDRDSLVAELNQKIARYKKELGRRKRNALLKLLLKDWNKTIGLQEQKAWDRWNRSQPTLQRPKLPQILISPPEASPSERFPLLRLQSLEGELTDPELKAGEALVQEEKNVLLRDNLIINAFRSAGLREAPLAYVNVFKFFEELMERKYEVDQGDLTALRRPRGMTEFMMEHLSRNFGLKSLAVKFLCQLLPALQTLYKQNHPYGSLFARLLQVFHRDPISLKLAVFLTRTRIQFNQLVEKTEKEKTVQSSSRSLPRKKQNLTSQQLFELAASGGEAYLADVIYLVYDMFEQARDYGQLLLSLIKPAAIDVSDFIIFKICHKMAKLGLTPESLYDLIDAKKEQNLLREEFIQGVQQTMDLWVDRADLLTLFSLIDRNTSETVSKEEFVLKINFDSYYFNVKNEYYVVSKSTFLNALTDVYTTMYQHQAARLQKVYNEVGARELSLTKFRQVVLSIDPHLDLSKVDQMYGEASRNYGDSQGVGLEAFCRTLLQHGIGALHLFETHNLEEATTERRSVSGGLDISLTSEGELVSVSSRRRSPVG